MIKFISNVLILCTILFSNAIFAQKIAGVEVAKTITVENSTLQLNGAGIRSKFFIDLYVGSLYLPTKSHNVEAILNSPQSVIRLNITSGLITAEKMTNAINEGFEGATNGNTVRIEPQIKVFLALFKAEIKDGDQFTFVANKKAGITAYRNNKKQATIKGDAFRIALLKIWLGKEPAQDSLKEKMLGLD